MSSDIFCLADNLDLANKIMAELKSQGFRDNQVSIVLNETSQSNEIATSPSDPAYDTSGPTATTIGGVTGAGLGAALGWSVTLVALPWAAPFVAFGPLLTILGSAVVGGTTGGLLGALVGVGIPKHHAADYSAKMHAGSILIAAHPADSKQLDIARVIAANYNAIEIPASELKLSH